MSFTGLAIRIAVPNPKIESLDRFLFVGPHPDDLEIGAGATAAKLAAQGKKVCFLICMDGRFGDGASNGVKGDALAALRREEARKSAAVLGVTDVRFLNLCDGNGYDQRELVRGVSGVIGDFQPDIVFGPDPESRSEIHADHLNTGAAVRELACFAPNGGIMERNYGAKAAPLKAAAYYMTARPNEFVKTKGFKKKQFEALECHKSQYPAGCAELDSLKLYLNLRSAEFGARRFCRAAEGFRVYNVTTMHCLPEAGE